MLNMKAYFIDRDAFLKSPGLVGSQNPDWPHERYLDIRKLSALQVSSHINVPTYMYGYIYIVYIYIHYT